MKEESIIAQKSKVLWIEVSKYYISLKKKWYYEIASQLFRSGTSIGANIQEAKWWESTKDFVHKMQISLKECYETLYRLDILSEGFQEDIWDLRILTIEVKKILSSIVITMKSKLSKK